MNARASLLPLTLGLISTFSFGGVVRSFQARQHLTPEEIELVKDAQELDKRTEVFIKAADRRVLALTGVAYTNTKQSKKDSEAWGEPPTGTRAELIGDIARIFDEAITNIDDVAIRDEKNPLLAKSLRKLAAAASRVLDQLKPQPGQAKSDAEAVSLDQLTENAESIIEAANKLPQVVEKKKSQTEKAKDAN